MINLCTNSFEDNRQTSSFTISPTDTEITEVNEISVYRPKASIFCVIISAPKSRPGSCIINPGWHLAEVQSHFAVAHTARMSVEVTKYTMMC